MANFTGQLLKNYKWLECKIFRTLLKHISDDSAFSFCMTVPLMIGPSSLVNIGRLKDGNVDWTEVLTYLLVYLTYLFKWCLLLVFILTK